MKKVSTIILINMVVFVLALSGAYAADMMRSEGSSTIQYATNLIGATVINNQAETLGKIIDLTIDQNRITFAVLSQSDVPGAAERLVPVPISALTIKDEKTVLLDINRSKLSKAPSFDRSQRPDFSSRQWTEDTYRFYGVQPHWKEHGMEKKMETETREMKEEMKEKQEKMEERMKPKY